MKSDQPSATALRVLEGLVYTAQRPSTAHLVEAEAREVARRLLARSSVGAARLRRLEGPLRRMYPLMERLFLPGIYLHYALRKGWIEQRVRAALGRQLLVLGGGYDTLALRLAVELPELACIEVDHPATQAEKRRMLDGEDLGPNFELADLDFNAGELADRLRRTRLFDPDAPTVVVCEGVLPYLDEAETIRLFGSIRRLLTERTPVVFTFMSQRTPAEPDPYGPLLWAYLRLVGEPFRLQVSATRLEELLAGCGFDLQQVAAGPEVLAARGGAEQYRGRVHTAECLGLAISTPQPMSIS